MSEHSAGTAEILCLVCTCGNVMPKRVRDEETGRYSGEWCGHIGTAKEVVFVPESTRDELWEIAIGDGDHDPRCMGECGPCGGVGGVPDTGPNGETALTCLTCGGDGKCRGCSVGFLLKASRRELAELREVNRA